MFDLDGRDKAINIRAIVSEWDGEKAIIVENVPGRALEHTRVKIITDVGEEFIVSAWDMLRAIKACSGIGSEE